MPRFALVLVAVASLPWIAFAVGGCTGEPCPMRTLCRSKWNWCGFSDHFCNSESTWTAACDGQPATSTTFLSATTSMEASTTVEGSTTAQVMGDCTGLPCSDLSQCRSKWGWCGSSSHHCNTQSSWTSTCSGSLTSTTSGVLPVSTTTMVSSDPATTTANPDPLSRCAEENSGCPEPDGRGISAWFTKEMFDEMFPQICNANCKGCSLLTYNCLIQATLLYPKFASSGSVDENRRELAAWLGIMSQETTGGGCLQSTENPDGSCTCGPMWCDSFPGGGCEAWGLCKLAEETTDTYCDSTSFQYPCVAGKAYSGRGPKQLSWNSNYGQFSQEFCGDKNILLNHPERVATNPTLAWASSIWFWFSGGACVRDAGENCKPGCHDVMLGLKKMCPADVAAGRQYGLGWATNIVNGGLECGSSGRGKCDYRVHSRVKYYRRFCQILGVDPLAPGWTDDENLFCNRQKNYMESPATEC